MAKQQEERLIGSGAQRIEGALTGTERFIERYRRPLLLGLLGVVLVISGVLVYRQFVQLPREQEARNQIFPAQQRFELDSFEVALHGDGNMLGFLQVIESYSGTKTANLARYYAGICHRELGNWEEALRLLRTYDRTDEMVAPVALGAMGDCCVELGDFKTAMSYYAEASSFTRNTLTTPIFLMKRALLQEQQHDWAGASSTYERVSREYPNSPQARTAEKLWARARAKMQ